MYSMAVKFYILMNVFVILHKGPCEYQKRKEAAFQIIVDNPMIGMEA